MVNESFWAFIFRLFDLSIGMVEVLSHSLGISLYFVRLESMGPPYYWNELITLSTKYRDLTSHAQLALTVSPLAIVLTCCRGQN